MDYQKKEKIINLARLTAHMTNVFTLSVEWVNKVPNICISKLPKGIYKTCIVFSKPDPVLPPSKEFLFNFRRSKVITYFLIKTELTSRDLWFFFS